MTNKTAAMILQEYATKHTGSPPYFNIIPCVQGSHENEFICEVEVMGISTSAKGRSKKEAKQEASKNALYLLQQNFSPELGSSIPSNLQGKVNEDNELKSVTNYIGILGDVCAQYGINSPNYIEISAVGPSHAMEFTYECHLGTSMRTRSTAGTKKQAKQNVAKEMYDRIKSFAPLLAKEAETDTLRLCEQNQIAMETHSELSLIKSINLGLQVQNYNQTLGDLMKEKNIMYEDVEKYFADPWTEFKLATLLEQLELEYSFEELESTNDSFIYALNVTHTSPLCTFGSHTDKEPAKTEAMLQMLKMIQEYISPMV